MFSIRFPALFAVSVLSSAFAQAQTDAPPVVVTGGNSGNDYSVDCNNVFAPGSAVTTVQLDGSGSFDPDGTPVTFYWHNECTFGVIDNPTSPTPVYRVEMDGVCNRTCWIALRVSSGGQTSVIGFRVIVADVTAPLLVVPSDVVDIWGDPTTVGATGVATAVDNCDPAPIVSFTDVSVPQPGPGYPELVLERTWTATDCNGFQSSSVQTISLLSPTGATGYYANLDFEPAQCPNLYSATPTGTLDVLLLGAPSFRCEKVIKPTLRLWVRGNPNVSIAPSSFQLKDLGSVSATVYGECNSGALDGKRDLRLRFSRAALAAQLGLANYASGETVEIAVTGRMASGKLFAVRDLITIQ